MQAEQGHKPPQVQEVIYIHIRNQRNVLRGRAKERDRMVSRLQMLRVYVHMDDHRINQKYLSSEQEGIPKDPPAGRIFKGSGV